MWQRAVNGSSGGGSNTVKFTFRPTRYSGIQDYIAFETANFKHFKAQYNSALSYYANDASEYVVGYTNSIGTGAVAVSLVNYRALKDSPDFDIDTTYTYLVVALGGNAVQRAYDIELTM